MFHRKKYWIGLFTAISIFLLLYVNNYSIFKNRKPSSSIKLISKPDKNWWRYRIVSSHQNLNAIGWTKFSEEVYGFSAYWDNRIGKFGIFARVIGIIHRNVSTLMKLKCYVKSGNYVTEAAIFPHVIGEFHEMNHTAIMFICTPKVSNIPRQISIISSDYKNARVWIPIQKPRSTKSFKNKMAVCVRPLFGPFNNTLALAQFIAYYKIIGFSHFIFYVQEITEEVRMFLLKIFKNEISIDLLPWFLPDGLKDTWAQGQLASIQDCIYRYMYLFEYLLIVDLDERLVPKRSYTMQQTMNDFISMDSNINVGAFMIRHTYFCTEKPHKNSQKPYLLINNIKRMRTIWPAEQRSKLLLKPEAIEVCGIHSVQKMFNGWKQIELPPQLAILNHYRINACDDINNLINEQNLAYVNDFSAKKYVKQMLNSSVMQIWKKMSKNKL